VKLVTQEECLLSGITHLILELSFDGRVIGKVKLISRDSNPGVWNADEPLIVYVLL
jgi:hypothetical protein